MLMTKPSNNPLDVIADLVRANISDQLIGKVARELVAQEEQRRPQPQRDTSAPEPTPEAVAASETPTPTPTPTPTRNVVIDCKDSRNKRTTVSFTPVRWESLTALEPNEQELRQAIRRLAESAPSRGRSGWIYKTLHESLKARAQVEAFHAAAAS